MTYVESMTAARAAVTAERPWDEVLALYMAAYRADPSRAEPLFELGRRLRVLERYSAAYQFLHAALDTPMPSDGIDLDESVYRWRALDECAIAAYHAPGHREESTGLHEWLFRVAPASERQRIIGHLAMCRDVGTEYWAARYELPPLAPTQKIPKRLHQIWIGPKPPPMQWMRTWQERNPSWEYKLWDNARVAATTWRTKAQIDAQPEWNGKADILRYEILAREGGVVFDADSECVRPLDPHFLGHDVFACYENEHLFPGRIATGYIGAAPGDPFMRACVDRILAGVSLAERAWITVGPVFFTNLVEELRPSIHIYPARSFIPEHWNIDPELKRRARAPLSKCPTYARQFWGSTVGYPEQPAAPRPTALPAVDTIARLPPDLRALIGSRLAAARPPPQKRP